MDADVRLHTLTQEYIYFVSVCQRLKYSYFDGEMAPANIICTRLSGFPLIKVGKFGELLDKGELKRPDGAIPLFAYN